MVAIGCTLVTLMVEALINQFEYGHGSDPVMKLYRRLRQSKCDLVATLASSKYLDTRTFFEKLNNGAIQINDKRDLYKILRLLFCDLPAVKTICATSYGELREWRDTGSWWVKTYLAMHQLALQQRKSIRRIFILDKDEQGGGTDDVLKANRDAKVIVKTTAQESVSPEDFGQASNCLVFYDRHGKPLYCFQAFHDQGSHFTKAVLYIRYEDIESIVQAFARIEAIAQVYA
jgi:hypothetical protein